MLDADPGAPGEDKGLQASTAFLSPVGIRPSKLLEKGGHLPCRERKYIGRFMTPPKPSVLYHKKRPDSSAGRRIDRAVDMNDNAVS